MDEFGERRRKEDLVTELGRKENTMVLGTEEICCTTESEIQGEKILRKNVSEYSLGQELSVS